MSLKTTTHYNRSVTAIYTTPEPSTSHLIKYSFPHFQLLPWISQTLPFSTLPTPQKMCSSHAIPTPTAPFSSPCHPPMSLGQAVLSLLPHPPSCTYLTTAGGDWRSKVPCSVWPGDWYCGHLPYQSPHLHFCKWEREQFTCRIGVPATSQSYKVAVIRTTPQLAVYSRISLRLVFLMKQAQQKLQQWNKTMDKACIILAKMGLTV